MPQDLFTTIAKGPLRGGIELPHPPVTVQGDDGIEGGFHDRRLEGLALPHLDGMAPAGLFPRPQDQLGELLDPVLQQDQLVGALTEPRVLDLQGAAGKARQPPHHLVEPRRDQIDDQGEGGDEYQGGDASLPPLEDADVTGHTLHVDVGHQGGEEQVQVRALVARQGLGRNLIILPPAGQGAVKDQPGGVHADQDALIVRVHQGDGAVRGQQAPLGGEQKTLVQIDEDHQAAQGLALAILDGAAHHQIGLIVEAGQHRPRLVVMAQRRVHAGGHIRRQGPVIP